MTEELLYYVQGLGYVRLAVALEHYRERYGEEWLREFIRGGNEFAHPDGRQGLLL